MKLRTTVQISSAIQKTKPTLKREDSFLKRFSTRQVPELQETAETGFGGSGEGSSWCGGGGGGRGGKGPRPGRRPLTVVDPDEDFYYYWLLVLTLCVLYNLWTLIVRQSFPELRSAAQQFWTACDAVTDVVFVLDIGVQLRTGYLEQGLVVYDSKKLAGRYLRSRAFLLDIAALFPLDLLRFNIGAEPILRFPRFFKVYRVYDYYYIVESRTVYPNVWRVVNLIHILLILAHWFGCFYYLLSEAEGFQGDWVYPYRPGEYATLTRKYLGSLYWSTLTLTTIGDLPTPETNAEYVFTIVSYLIGVFIFATIVGQVGNVITNRNANRLEFERLLDGAKTYMRHHKVPGGMKRRVLRWYDYSWSRGRIQGGGDINTALGLLPDKLKTELALHVNLSVLKKVTIFQECQPEFLHDLVLKMKAYIFTPGDLICRKGEVAREMFIIADGILEVISSETGRVLTTMKAGDFFGEIGILNLDGLNKRTADVRSVGYSELFSLSREDVLTAMKDYPEAQEILQSLGRKRLMEARNKEKVISPPSTGENLDDSAGKRIVEKIRSDVKELKNVLRKSKRGSRSRSDCTEMESVSKTKDFKDPSSSNKGILCRMTRISHEDSTQDDNLKSPSGPGLPILHRLKHLKDKQESDGAKKSPYQSTNQNSVAEENKDSEVIGQGLPLLQRLMLLKQKEANDSAPSAAQAAASTVRTQHKSPSSHIIKARRKSKEDEDNAHEAPEIKVEQQDADKNCLDKQSWTILRKATVLTGSMSETSTDAPKESSPVAISFQVNSEQADPIANVQSSPPETAGNQHTAGKLMERSVVTREKTQVPHIFSPLNTSSGWGGNFRIRRAKKRCSPLGKPKIYKSIDDLSPEYSGLPFVKKLKILNERQKIAELERDQFVRSSSLDSAGSVSEPRELTRSHSEAVAIEVVLRNREAAAGPTSPEESDETPERRKLKSILKKLSTAARDPAGRSSPLESDYSEMKRLMRAQTVEGYAARHSKLTKSVTFDRAGSDSSPSPNLLLSQPPNAPSHPRLLPAEREPTTLQPPQVIETEFIRSGATPKSRGIEHFGDIFLGIKEIIQEHLVSTVIVCPSCLYPLTRPINLYFEYCLQDEIRDNYVNRLSSLELELRRRDSIISQLQKRIQELEVYGIFFFKLYFCWTY
ncbi:hypothetical protein AAG570_012821 [Ranatra chinensis]|uniref:Cyclic nucleotide-binding domain-containing protein n=1 Tax=Ranatra chinensis TaxID=642074 RepID=A0ABD0YTM3_9HEMI